MTCRYVFATIPSEKLVFPMGAAMPPMSARETSGSTRLEVGAAVTSRLLTGGGKGATRLLSTKKSLVVEKVHGGGAR